MLPKILYDALPWIYLTLGAMSTAMIDGGLKYLPATLFILAGCLVLSYRYLLKPAPGHRDVPAKRVNRELHRH